MLPFILSKPLHFLFVSSLFFMFSTHVTAQPLNQICGGDGNYTVNSTFQTNLNTLLTSLSTNTALTGFYNATIGNNPNRVYGLALCRGDLTADVCQSCLTNASKEIIQQCPQKKIAYIWYDFCLLRYSNQSFFSKMETSNTFYMWNIQNTSDPNRSDKLFDEMMNNISSFAALNSTGMFATGEAKFTGNQAFYGLAQCTRDISRTACKKCLEGDVSLIASTQLSGKQGGRVLGPSCNIRYESYLFYNIGAAAPAPSPLLPPSTTTTGPAPSPLFPPSTTTSGGAPPPLLPPPTTPTGTGVVPSVSSSNHGLDGAGGKYIDLVFVLASFIYHYYHYY